MSNLYMCIDLKSFYASVECVERGIDPLSAKLVVADPERTERTICLAVSPALKAMGVRNRCRVFEIPKNIDYIMAVPRMSLYIDYSARIYSVYLRYICPDDIHVYSIDEVFIDAESYVRGAGCTPREYGQMLMKAVLDETGITATCGIGTNMYLAKIALDIISKHSPDRIGILTEESYRKQMWGHKPLTDFWRISTGTVERLAKLGISTMGEIAAADERALYKAFGIDAELLIDHAWGRESVTMADIKSYRSLTHSLTSGQVLPRGYKYEEAGLVVREMTEQLAYEMFESELTTESLTMYLGYEDMPPAKGTVSAGARTCSANKLTALASSLYREIAHPHGLVRRVNIVFNRTEAYDGMQYDIFSDVQTQERENNMQRTIINIKHKYGKNGIFKASDLLEGARTLERNSQIGGHRA